MEENPKPLEVIVTDKKVKKRTGLKILLGLLCLVILAGVVVGSLILREVRAEKDSDNYETYLVLSENLNLVEKVSEKRNVAVFEPVKQLPFGAKLTLSVEEGIVEQDGKIYLPCKRYTAAGRDFQCKDAYYVETLLTSDIEQYANTTYTTDMLLRLFPIKQTQALPSSLKKAVMDYLEAQDMENYVFTPDANRIDQTIVKADLTRDGVDDYALTLQCDDYTVSLIFCYNPDLKTYYQAYYDNFYGRGTVRLFEQGALVFKNSETLVKAPERGIMSQTSYAGISPEQANRNKFAILYDPDLGQFTAYAQVPLSELNKEYDDTVEQDGEDYDAADDEHVVKTDAYEAVEADSAVVAQ